MVEFSGFILTNKGRELLAKAVAGETLTFTKISFGDGLYEGDKKEIQELAGLRNVFFINQIKKTGVGQVSLRAVITNRAVETGYHIKEIGIYAVCGNEEEVLYAYNTAVEADYLPPFNGNNLIELEYQNYIVIDQAEKVTAIIDPSATYLTKEEAEEIYVPQTQVAGEKNSGIVSKTEIRKEIGYLSGAEYAGKFGSDLISIEKGKVYYYYDLSNNSYISYLAIETATKSSGFITPDSLNFKNISNNYLSKIIEDIEGFRFIIDKEEKLLRVFRFDRVTGGNIKTMNWVYDKIILIIKKHNYNLINNTFVSSYFVHQASNIKASYSVYFNSVFVCYTIEQNQVIDTNLWYFHTGELIIPIV